MHPLFSSFILLSAWSFSVAARADTIVTYNFNATYDAVHIQFGGAGSATGLMTIDSTTGQVTSADVVVTPTAGSSLSFDAASSITQFDGTYFTFVLYSANVYDVSGDALELLFLTASLVGFNGGNFCAVTYANCVYNSAHFFAGYAEGGVAETATLTPITLAVVTPEPSGPMLLGAGMVGTFAALRRKYLQS